MTSFNEQAAFLIEDAVALIKQVLIKHSAAVLEEMRDQIVARNTRIAALESEVAALRAEVEGMREDAERYRWLVENSFDIKGVTQFHIWRHEWEPHSKTGEPTEWKSRVRGPAIDAAIDAARKESSK